MNIHIEGINITITEPLHEHAKSKINKVFEMCNRLSKVDIEMKQENNAVESFKVTGLLHLDGTENIVLTLKNENAYTAINQLQQNMLRQVNKIKNN